MEKINTRKLMLAIIFILILAVTFLLVSKATYSFLAPDLDEDIVKSGEVTASGDSLIFMSGDPINLTATTDNFGSDDGDLTTTTNPKVKLIASSKTNNANAKYYVGINISNNTYKYSTTEKTPELILRIRDEKGQLVKTTSDNTLVFNETIQGFDITEKSGIIHIAEEHLISTTSSTTGETHTWTP